MTSYNTGNPIGSKDPRDLYDNAENLDEAVNTRTAESWNDRLGVARKTWWGMEQDFQQFLINSGYQNIGDYGPGLEITARNQIFWRDGELYRAGAALELPYTTTGDWSSEEGLFVAVGDQALRQELADPVTPELGSVIVGRSSVTVGSIDDLRSIPEEAARPDLTYEVKDYYGDGEGGGGRMKFVPGENTPDDNYMHFGNHSTGRWVRSDAEIYLDARKLGLRKSTPHANAARLQQALDDLSQAEGGAIQLPAWIFEIEDPLYIGNKTTLQGVGTSGTQIVPTRDTAAIIVEHRDGRTTGRVMLRDLFIHHKNNTGDFAGGHGIVIRGNETNGKIWKPSIINVQTYKCNIGIDLRDQAVETFLSNVELGGGGVGRIGLMEAANCYDTVAIQLYADSCTRFGMELFGGSGQFFHFHAVACGTDDGEGTVTGGGLNLRTNYNNFYNPHFDRNVGVGVVIGGGAGETPLVGNKFFGIQSFNNGHGPSQPTVKSPNVLINRNEDLEFHGGMIGRVGTDLADNNIRGVVFGATDWFGAVKFFGTHFRGNTEHHIYSGGDVPVDAVKMIAPSFSETVSIMNGGCRNIAITDALGAGSNTFLDKTQTATLSGNSFNAFGGNHWLLHPQGNASDDLVNIQGAAMNKTIYIRRHPQASNSILVRQTGNIRLKTTESGQDYYSLNSSSKILQLAYVDGGNWVEI